MGPHPEPLAGPQALDLRQREVKREEALYLHRILIGAHTESVIASNRLRNALQRTTSPVEQPEEL